ncbi:MAG: transcription-repair coupling factor [Clostridia bacterium]|nr:transcription-repair coupling factor [Clostridia bacterium]
MKIVDKWLGENFTKIFDSVRAKKSCSAFGVQNSLRAPIANMCSKNILYVASDYITATKIKDHFEALGRKTFIFSAGSDNFIYKKAQSNTNNIMRTQALESIFSNTENCIICTTDSLFAPLCSPQNFASSILHLKVGQTFAPKALALALAKNGYVKSDFASEEGLFSARGEIVDVFVPGAKSAVRIDYFDDQIESISVLSDTGSAVKQISSVKICPFSNLLISEAESKTILSKVQKLEARVLDDANEQAIFSAQVEDLIKKLESGERTYSMDMLLSFLPQTYSIFDYIAASGMQYDFYVDEAKLIFDMLVAKEKENNLRLKELESSQTLIGDRKGLAFSLDKILKDMNTLTGVVFQKITNANKFFDPKVVIDFNSKPISKYVRDTEGLAHDLNIWFENGFTVYFCVTKTNAKQLQKNLSAYDIDLDIYSGDKIPSASAILASQYPNGFILPHERVVVIGNYDLFAKQNNSSKLTAGRNDVFSIPKVGDYVVHAVHGIGVCEGVTQLSGTFGTKDYVVVRYRDGDKLYVPTTQMNLLDRFTGGEAPKKLSKIGGQDFEKVKEKVKQSVKKLAFDLVQLYAKREALKGFPYSEDNMVQKEFENSFEYVETEDQLSSISEIKKDMQSTKVMDRLLCGDVGFGKTEVAMRAMFKAVLDNKQVAFLSPTTILSQQHYNTCKKRMEQFGVNVEVLNRFKTPKQVKDILQKLKEHKIDVLCSTHRALSNDVEFADLGLIVLDEEQKFGVNDKEKLKNKHPNIDVLTLSATPIPRTLHMSLSGIRDISVISTPPSERLPISTYVTEFSDSLVRDAITREMSRGGQTFILYNRVETIYDFAAKIKQIVPDAKVLVGHGQLPANVLEQVVYDFYTGKADVLVCTTIMENGVDIENANTLIVCDADRFGLSQLYQIRGRVGRGNKMAYAYFTYDYDKSLTEEAYKRLDAISEFTEFGSGFKLAMRDLEIRGSGNVLGAEQHGFLQKVGYDMYSKLLAQAVAEARGERYEQQTETQMKVEINAYVPENYITESEQRMIAYKKIAAISSAEELGELVLQFENNFGKVPLETQNLMDIALTKNMAGKLKISELVASKNASYLLFDRREDIMQSEKLANAISKFRNVCSLDFSDKPKIKFENTFDANANYQTVKKFINSALN